MSHARMAVTAALCLAALAVPRGVQPGLDAATTQDLNARALKRAEAERKRCGGKYAAHVDLRRHLVYISALDDEHLRRMMRMLSAHAAAYRKTLPCEQPPWNVVVVLITADDFDRLMPKIKAAPQVKPAGVYDPTTHRVTAIDRGEVLRHEFTHALHHADACAARQSHPIWLREGLAMCCQDAKITPAGLEPVLDGELWTLQKAVRDKRVLPFRTFFTMGQKTFLKTPALSYAQAKYVVYYLHHRGRLADFYRRYKAAYTKDPSGLKAFEAVLGNRADCLERRWCQWVSKLKFEGNPARLAQGRLGLKMRNDPKGAKITGLLDGGAAKRTGRLRVGDIIVKFNGTTVRNVVELGAAIRAAGAMRTVPVEILRRGRKETIYQPLGAPEG